MTPEPRWRDDIDALAFHPAAHAGSCIVHRLAFRRLLGRNPAAADCVSLFRARADAFEAAAAAKIAARGLPPYANFHLTSRDLERARNAATAALSIAREDVRLS